MDIAVAKFKRSCASIDARKDAVRDLVDVLEDIRPIAKLKLQNEDESDLFNIINKFGIRHKNEDQKTNYDKPIWLSRMFHYFLATIHAILQFSKQSENNEIK